MENEPSMKECEAILKNTDGTRFQVVKVIVQIWQMMNLQNDLLAQLCENLFSD